MCLRPPPTHRSARAGEQIRGSGVRCCPFWSQTPVAQMARSLAAPALVLAALASVARAVRVFAIDDLAPARAALPEDLVRRALALLPPPVAFCSDGREVQLHLGGPATRPVERWPQEFRVVRLQFFPAGDRLMCVGRSVAGVWDVWASRSVAALRHEGLLDVQIFPGGDRVVTLGADSRAVVWSVSDAEVLRAWRVRHGHSAVRVLRSGNRLATGIGGGSAVLWSAEGGEVVRLQHPGGENVVSLEAASCGEKLGTADLVTVALWDASGGLERVFTRPAETHWQQRLERPCFALSEGGAVVVGRGVTSIFVWDGGTGDLRRTGSGAHERPQPQDADQACTESRGGGGSGPGSALHTRSPMSGGPTGLIEIGLSSAHMQPAACISGLAPRIERSCPRDVSTWPNSGC